MAEKDFKDAPVYHDSFAPGSGTLKNEIDEALDNTAINNNVSAMSVAQYFQVLEPSADDQQDQEPVGGY